MSSLLAHRRFAMPVTRPAAAVSFSLDRLAASGGFCILILLIYCGWLFFYGLWEGELWRTESLRAIIGQEMLRSGNWIVPRLYGEPLFTKPPGMYIAIALFSLPFGQVTEFSARLPSAVAATVTVLLFYWYFRRQLGATAGFVAGLILPMSLMWIDKGNSAEIDMLQAMWVTGAILFFLRAMEGDEREAKPWFWWVLSLLFVAGGFLTKWTAPAFFYLTAVSFLWWQGRLRVLWSRHHLVSASLAAALCVAWIAAAVASEGWELFYATTKEEALHRLVPSYVPQRPYPWLESLYHPLRLILTTLPWSLLALVTLRPGFFSQCDERSRPLLAAMQCWTWPNMLLWTLMSEHTPRHSFPLFPGIAGLATLTWLAWWRGSLTWPVLRISPVRLLALLLALWIGVKATFLWAIVPSRNFNREPRATGRLIAAHIPLGQILYLFRLKDEGTMFYYGRPVLRLNAPAQLPSSHQPLYCILNVSEWHEWSGDRPAEAILHLVDGQGAPIVLVCVTG